MVPGITPAQPSDIDYFSRTTYMNVYSGFGTIRSDLSVILQNARFQLLRHIELCDETQLIAQMLCSRYCISIKLDRDYYYVVFRNAKRCDTLLMGTCCADLKGIRPVDLFIYIAQHMDAAHPSRSLSEAG